jgi:ribosome-associated translation inhibitor RaiA
MIHTQVLQKTDVRVRLLGQTPVGCADQARTAVADLLAHRRERVIGATVKLTQQRCPGPTRPARAEASLDLGSSTVRAHVAGATMDEAIDLLTDRLAARLIRLSDRQRAVQRPRQYAHRPERHPLARTRREIVRRKYVASAPMDVDEAVFQLEALDHDFYLFADASTGADGLVAHGGPTGFRLARTVPSTRSGATWAQVTVSPVPAAHLTEAEAILRLEASAAPFVFFADRATGRGTVVYHRLDGHYGVVAFLPAAG